MQRLVALPPPPKQNMNTIYIGTRAQVELPKGGCLYIADEVPDMPRARVFDPTTHSFNPLKGLDYRKQCAVVDIFDTLFPRGENTLTKDTGLDFIAEALADEPQSFDTLIAPPTKSASTGHIWAYGKTQRLMRSPVLKQMLCTPTNFSFNPRSTILARVNRAELGDLDALAIGQFLIGQFQGQIVIPDGGFYLKDTHVSLIRENRLIAGVRFLDELPQKLRRAVLLIDDKQVAGALHDDAVLLAKHAGLHPDPTREDNGFNKFVEEAL